MKNEDDMGILNEQAPDHEGYPVAYVRRGGVGEDSLLVRELQYPGDNGRREDIILLGAGCECGWRSSHFWPTSGDRLTWMPFSVCLGASDEERWAALWREHVQEVVARRAPAAGARKERLLQPLEGPGSVNE